MTDFVHLHVHTEYSLRQSTLRLKDYIEAAKALRMSAVAMTDSNVLYGAVEFYTLAKEAGLKPIIGVQLQVARDADANELAQARPNHPPLDSAVFLAENFAGYQNLVKLVTLAQSRIRLPFVTFSELKSHMSHLFALVGGGESVILRSFSAQKMQEGGAWLDTWKKLWPDTYLYIDVQDHAVADERRGLPKLVKWARDNEVPMVATNDVHYLDAEDADTQRILSRIEGSSSTRQLTGERYELASQAEMEKRFSKLPAAILNSSRIAERCQLELPLDRTLLPKYPTTNHEPASIVLRRAAEMGVKQRYGDLNGTLVERLNYELDVIGNMGFSDYFLVVADFIRYAHKHGISTGPGRGSATGSLVSYALRITDVDPLKNKLLFERFLNPERVSWPDIDTDFEYERRSEVIDYVVERYGATHVAQIGTFGTLAARAAIRDAGRALEVDTATVNQLAKLIPSYPGVTLRRAYEEVSAIGLLLKENARAQQLWDTAAALEGLPRHTSVHAAGVVISPIPLTDLVPVQPGGDGTPVTQYAMADIEKLGLIKMDFLGLRTLSLIDVVTKNIERKTGERWDWRHVSERDSKTYEMLTKGDTDGCFQLESSGVRRVLRDLKPTHMEDLVAVISLYRPGPMENIPTFIAAKHGRKAVHYPHEDLRPILEDTYGVIVYQEQIMQIAAVMAGFSLGQADLLRRAVSKKKRHDLDAQRSRFVAGCLVRGYEEQVATDVYDLIVRFADYGFNRCHAAAYAVLAYRTAYLKANYPAEFLSALLTMNIGAADKLEEYARFAKSRGITILPPCVQSSERTYRAIEEKVIRTGLLAIRNVGHGAVDAILTARGSGSFQSLTDFLRRVNSRACNRKAVESLLAAGALDTFFPEGALPTAKNDMLQEAYHRVGDDVDSTGLGLKFGNDLSTKAQASEPDDEVIYIRYNASKTSREDLEAIKQALVSYRGTIRVALYDTDKRKIRMLEEKFGVTFTPELITLLEDIVGIGNVRMGSAPKRMTSRSKS